MKKILLLLGMVSLNSFSQVGINTTSPNAQLDIKASNQGVPSNKDGILIPKIDAFPLSNPTAAQQGMLVYLTTTVSGKSPGFYYWDNTASSWKGIDGDSGWSLNGNSGTGAANFIGTTDNQDVVFKRNSTKAGLLGDYVTGFGASVLNANTTGTGNTAYGAYSLWRNTTGSYNVALGSDAMSRMVEGSRGTAIGYASMFYFGGPAGAFINTNTAIGYYSMLGEHSGSAPGLNNYGLRNTAVGYQSLQGISSGNDNSGIGYNSLYANSSGYNNTAFGSSALSANTTGAQNTAVGKSALEANTIGISNVAIGSEALSDNTTGGNNIAIGYGALTSNTTGSFNQSVGKGLTLNTTGSYNLSYGFEALHNNSTASYNLAFGYQSLFNNTSGNYNIAIGQTALRSNTTGDNNLAIGINALNASTTASHNLAIGESALRTNTTGMFNFAIGLTALSDNTSGIYNSAVGHAVMRDNITGSHNAGLGYGAMLLHTAGVSNVAIGNYALRDNLTGSGNVALGYQAGLNELGSNRLYIENSGAATPLIYGEFDNDLARVNGNFRINSTTVAGDEMQVKNSNLYAHNLDANLNFGSGGGYFMASTQDGTTANETAGIRGDGDNVSIWSPGDGSRLLRLLDEDSWGDNDGNPYNNSAEKAYIDSNGQYFQVSDAKQKENIKVIDGALDKLKEINGYTYTFKLNAEEAAKKTKTESVAGFLAQELETVLPQAVSKNEFGEYHVNYAAVLPLTVQALKEQQEMISQQQQKNQDLQEEIRLLKENQKAIEEKLRMLAEKVSK